MPDNRTNIKYSNLFWNPLLSICRRKNFDTQVFKIGESILNKTTQKQSYKVYANLNADQMRMKLTASSTEITKTLNSSPQT